VKVWKRLSLFHEQDLGFMNKNMKNVQQQGHKLLNFENAELHVVHARSLEEENQLIQPGSKHVCYNEKDEVAIYRKRK
jgi:hypothetical protein